jgi:hypothetical protein
MYFEYEKLVLFILNIYRGRDSKRFVFSCSRQFNMSLLSSEYFSYHQKKFCCRQNLIEENSAQEFIVNSRAIYGNYSQKKVNRRVFIANSCQVYSAFL